MIQNNKRNAVAENMFAVLICILLGGIAISLSSKNSFLYEFNDSGDIQVFVNTAKCMLRGDVLYRDVFDVKGPYLYFLYALGLMIDGDSFLGIFLLEAVLFIAYLIVNYRIASLYLNNKILKVFVVAAVAFVSTTTYALFGGGQCEELLLPFFAATIYIVIKYFRQQYPSRIQGLKVILIGFFASVVFWTKYALLGLFLGVVIYLIYLQIKNRGIKELWIYIGEFLLGFLIGTIPVLGYFISNNAVADLFEVYFYNLIFCYKASFDETINIFKNNFYLYFIGASALTAFAFVYSIVGTQENMNKQERGIIFWMIMMQAVGTCFSRYWPYSPESMHAFSGLGAVCIFLTVADCRSRGKELLKKMAQVVNKFLNEKSYTQGYFFLFLIAMLLLIDTELFILPIVVAVGSVALAQATRILFARIADKTKAHKKFFLIKYCILVLSCYVVGYMGVDVLNVLKELEPAAILYLFVIAVLLVALDDYYVYEEKVNAKVEKFLKQCKQEYKEKRIKINIYATCVGIILFAIFCFVFSKSTYDIGSNLEDKPQYAIAEYINNSGIDDPVIITWWGPEKGIYWLTNSYPPIKYSWKFNVDIPEIDAVLEEYVSEKKADFIVTEGDADVFEGYRQVYLRTDYNINTMRRCTLRLLEKEQ